jgi:hypothetical protein
LCVVLAAKLVQLSFPWHHLPQVIRPRVSSRALHLPQDDQTESVETFCAHSIYHQFSWIALSPSRLKEEAQMLQPEADAAVSL